MGVHVPCVYRLINLWVSVVYLAGWWWYVEVSVYRLPSGLFLQPASQLPCGGAWEFIPLPPELELLFVDPMFFSFLAYPCFAGEHAPVVPGAIGWWIRNIISSTLHI